MVDVRKELNREEEMYREMLTGMMRYHLISDDDYSEMYLLSMHVSAHTLTIIEIRQYAN